MYSHDFERALCRFWLRGTCAKGETCEFLHALPTNIDVNGITNAMAHTDLNNQGRPPKENSPPPDEFPTLDRANGSVTNKKGTGYGNPGHYDPGRTRFAAAVKKPATTLRNEPNANVARRDSGPTGDPARHRVTVVAPRPSPRLKLRPPTLLPTLPTGESVNKMYMSYRSRALQLGAARNACLSRAADAWRRGDGAAAKRFSREGHELNAKMSTEMVDAAGQLVKERAKLAEQAARARDPAWSDDPGDRTNRGKVVGGGLGVCLGIARLDVGGAEKLSPEERTEAALDLHGLHANEATEVLESFLLAVSNIFARASFELETDLVIFSWNKNISMDWVSYRAIISLLRHLLPIAVQSFVGPMSDSFLQLMPSLERKSTPELKTRLAARRVLGSLLAFVNGCICGDTLGANATMASSASIRSLTFEASSRCPDLNSPHSSSLTLVLAGTLYHSGLLCHRLSSTTTLLLKGCCGWGLLSVQFSWPRLLGYI